MSQQSVAASGAVTSQVLSLIVKENVSSSAREPDTLVEGQWGVVFLPPLTSVASMLDRKLEHSVNSHHNKQLCERQQDRPTNETTSEANSLLRGMTSSESVAVDWLVTVDCLHM